MLRLTRCTSIIICILFLILIATTTRVQADSFDDLLASRNALLRAGSPLEFDGDEYSGADNEWNTWNYFDGNRSDARITDNYDFDKFVSIVNTSGDPDTNYIPRRFNDLTFEPPLNFGNYNPDNPNNDKDTDDPKKQNIYTNLDNFEYVKNAIGWTGGTSDGFAIINHKKPASLIVKKVAFAKGKWIDMKYTVTLAGKSGVETSPSSGVDSWENYNRPTDGQLNNPRNARWDPSSPLYNPSLNYDQYRDVTLKIGSGNNATNWLRLDTYRGTASRNWNTTAYYRTLKDFSEATRWHVNIQFVENESTSKNPTPPENKVVDLSGTYQAYNSNARKLFAFDKDDLDITGTDSSKSRLVAMDTGNTKSLIKGHFSKNKSTSNFFEVRGSGIDNSGTNKQIAFLYLFNKGVANFTNIRSGLPNEPFTMYVNTSSGATVRAEVPYTDLDTTINNLGKVYDRTGERLYENEGGNYKYNDHTVQFKVYQKFPPQPVRNTLPNGIGVAPTVFKVSNVIVPDYVSINLDTIRINALNNKPIDAAIDNHGTAAGLFPPSDPYVPQVINSAHDDTNQTNIYNYTLDTSKLLSRAPVGVFDGFNDFFIKADLDFDLDWSKKEKTDSQGKVTKYYPWKKDVVEKEDVVDGVSKKYVAVKATGINTKSYRHELNPALDHYETDTDLSQTHTSLVQVPKETYNIKYVDLNNKPISVNNSAQSNVVPVKEYIGDTYDLMASDNQVNSVGMPKYLQDIKGKDYIYKSAALVDDQGNTTPLTSAELTKFEYNYNNNKPRTIQVTYDSAVSRTVFHYAEVNKTAKLDPSQGGTWKNPEIYNLIANSTKNNYTIRNYGPVDTPIQEELPWDQEIVDSSNKGTTPINPPSNSVTGPDFDSTVNVYDGAPAPKIKDHNYLGYYLFNTNDTTATFHPYKPEETDKTKNNAWVNTKYAVSNQIIVFVYANPDSSGLTLNPDKKIDFGSGALAKTTRQSVNNQPFNLTINESLIYSDPSMSWPDRHWDITVQAANFKDANGFSMLDGSKITLGGLASSYTPHGLDNHNSVQDGITNYLNSDFVLPLDNTEHQLLKVTNLKDTANSGQLGPFEKSESLKLTWNPSLNVPQGVNEGRYSTKLVWTIKNSIN